ncbi:MAG: VCBS repeat-containing protein, partial [Gammaproteobacteria bacterium]|nr:VCBS repeat-containing protein [Gammaproteobacteria bacterium]
MPRYPALCALALLIIWVFAPAGCGKRDSSNGDSDSGQIQERETAWFLEIASELGLDFVHESGVQGDYFLPEITGSGGAIFDYDNDGYLDVYLVQSESLAGKQDSRNRLFRQSPDGRFSDTTEEAGVGDPGYGMGTAVGDIDNDGDLDILVTNYGRDRLYRNNGGGTFTDITTEAGIHGSHWSTSAAFCDFDLDSYLDLYVVTYLTNDPPRACTTSTGEIEYCGPNAYRGVSDQLYRNNGDGTFSEISEESGISRVVNKGLGVVCFDFDSDNLPDIFVANDGENNKLWINRGDGTFEDRGIAFGVAVNIFGKPEASMGIALGDVDRDLSLDLFLTHLHQETNTLYLGTDGNALTDSTATSGLGVSSIPFTGFGAALFDADQDGDLDLIIANGRVRKGPDLWSGSAKPDLPARLESFLRAYAEPNILMENTGAGKYRDFCGKAGLLCSAVEVSRGLLTVDIDLDG